jgi:hypothetical protein
VYNRLELGQGNARSDHIRARVGRGMNVVDHLGLGKHTGSGIAGGAVAPLTSIDVKGISQKVIHKWPDQVGEIITPKPEPIDWVKWRAERTGETNGARAPHLPAAPMNRKLRRASRVTRGQRPGPVNAMH